MISSAKITAFFLALLCLACQSPDTQTNTTTIDSASTAKSDTTSRKDGQILPGLDHGFEQSPINILSQASSTDGTHKITFYFNDDINKIENLGHTIQLDFQEGSTITVDDTTFAFKQCHFHTPSEHHIDGISYPMEMHIVNVLPNAPKENPQYVVFGVLFKEGKENAFIKDFLNKIPKDINTSETVKAGVVRMADLFGSIPKELKGHYYHYKGSLTTPPYTESVRWYITKHIFEASAEQIEAIKAIEGDNARQVQALYGRTVGSK